MLEICWRMRRLDKNQVTWPHMGAWTVYVKVWRVDWFLRISFLRRLWPVELAERLIRWPTMRSATGQFKTSAPSTTNCSARIPISWRLASAWPLLCRWFSACTIPVRKIAANHRNAFLIEGTESSHHFFFTKSYTKQSARVETVLEWKQWQTARAKRASDRKTARKICPLRLATRTALFQLRNFALY